MTTSRAGRAPRATEVSPSRAPSRSGPTRTRRLVAIAPCGLLAACGSGTSSPSTPDPIGYTGQWRGNTYQGQPFSFVVSRDQKVTGISIGYALDGCSGTYTFEDLDVPIYTPPPFFTHAATFPDGRSVAINVVFVDPGLAGGAISFYGEPSCGGTGEGGLLNAERD